ncbi:hypothetical protein FPV67DRAFT_1666937 [Lyophyllum atratum]|nr:hypothetical protein FPV67DRAFT_1666937 [Lyophyllum atratum]
MDSSNTVHNNNATWGGENQPQIPHMTSGPSSSGGEGRASAPEHPQQMVPMSMAPQMGMAPSMGMAPQMGMPPQQNVSGQQYPMMNNMGQQPYAMPMPMMGGYPVQPHMAFQQMPYAGPGSFPQGQQGYPPHWYPQVPAYQQPPISRPQDPNSMDVDGARLEHQEQAPPRVPSPPGLGSRGPAAPPRRTRGDERQEAAREKIIQRLVVHGIKRDYCDFLDEGMAQPVLAQLLDALEAAMAEVKRGKAREEAMAEQLSFAKKRPAIASPDREEGSSRPAKVHQTDARRDDRRGTDDTWHDQRHRDLSPPPHFRPIRPVEPETRREDHREDQGPRRMDRRFERSPSREYRRGAWSPERDSRRHEDYRRPGPSRRADRASEYGPQYEDRYPERPGRETRPLPHRGSERSGPSTSVSVPPSDSIASLPSGDESRVKNPERRGKKGEVVKFSLPDLPRPPPVTNIQPPTPPPMARIDDEDDGRSSGEESDKPKSAKKKKGQETHKENMARQAANEQTGRIPDEVGVVFIDGRHERSNRFWDMLYNPFYWSAISNRVYTLTAAVDASRHEMETGTAWTLPVGRLYAVVPRGFPMNPREVDQLIKLIKDTKSNRNTREDRAQGFMLLQEFRRICLSVAPHLRDKAMMKGAEATEVAEVRTPFRDNDPIWRCLGVKRPGNAFEYRRDIPSRGAGLPPVDPEKYQFDINRWAKQLAHHGRIGTVNQTAGVPMDRAFRVHLRGVWGYRLADTFCPTVYAQRAWYIRVLACIAARPFLYSDAVEEHNRTNPDRPFVPIGGPDFEIQRFKVVLPATKVIEEDVIRHLIDSGFPIEWMHHIYTFGLHYLDHYYAAGAPYAELFRRVDDERLERLERRGVPPAMPQYDGWYYPTVDDITRIQTLIESEMDAGQADCRMNSEWLDVGSDPHFHTLSGRRVGNSRPPAPRQSQPRAPSSLHGGIASSTAGPSAPSTSTAVGASELSDAKTHADPMSALSAPLSSAAASASTGPSDNNPDNQDMDIRPDNSQAA